MKKSLMIITEAFELGGVETYIHNEAAELTRLGWTVHLVCGRRFLPSLVPAGLGSLTADLAIGPEASVEEMLGAVDKIVALARTHQVSAIHAHPFTSMIPALACASILRIPLFVTLHGPSSITGSYGAAYDFMLASLVLGSASRVVAVSEEVRSLASIYVPTGRLEIQQNVVGVPVAAATEVVPSDRWLAVSRLDPAKIEGLVEFTQAALMAGIAGVDICGAGPAQHRVEEALAAEIASGQARLIGSNDHVDELVLSYAGVAGMGRVALEGLVAGRPTVLVGYDGVKGVLGPSLYQQAIEANLSGRGVASISPSELSQQLRGLQAFDPESEEFTARVRAAHDPAAAWARFSAELQESGPVDGGVIESFIEQLRASHPHSTASAYWSREVMDVLAKVIGSRGAEASGLVTQFSVYAATFSRNLVEQETALLRDRLEQWSTHVEPHAEPMPSVAQVEDLVIRIRRMEQQLLSLTDSAAHQSDAVHSLVAQEATRTVEMLREDVAGISDLLHQTAARSSEDLRHETDRLRTALHNSAGHAAEAAREGATATSALVRSLLGNVVSDIRMDIQQEFEKLRGVAREAVDHADLMRREMTALRDSVRHQMLASAGEFRRDSRVAFIEVNRGLELKMERTLERMESEIKVELARVSGGLDVRADMDRDIEEMRAQLLSLEYELREVYSSSSWALTRPLRVLKRLVLHPRATANLVVEELRKEQDPEEIAAGTPRPGLWRRAMNFIRRTARTGRVDPADKARLISMVRTNYSAVVQNLGLSVTHPMLGPRGELADVFVWSVIDWHFRMQRPQHLAAALARKGHRVFYISNNFVDSAAPGFAVESLDDEGRLFQVNLHVSGAPQIYSDLATEAQVAAIRASLSDLLKWTETWKSISLVQHPYWIEPAQSLPNMRLIYDCMDHHGGFEDNAASVLAGERLLVERADLLVVTSQWLQDEMAGKSRNMALIRNATEYEHFCARPESVFIDPQGRQVIGYYGAIAEWFDVDLIRQVALEHPDALVLLVGRDTAGAEDRLSSVSNVRFVGEVPYKDLPYWVHGFDVCLLPFQVIPLTLATNPVKVYEYLSAGKPVVSVDLPEMSQFEGLVSLATQPSEFSTSVSKALTHEASLPSAVAERQAFAARQTWGHRAADLDAALDSIAEPKVSVIVLCYNNLEYTQACLHSIELYSDYANLEIIAVDNASSDSTPEYLVEWARNGTNRTYIANSTNLGFSAGNNVGLAAATGDYLVILNNDTYVTPGWVRGLVGHLRRNPTAGLVGPVTNNIGNEARIQIEYANMEEMIVRAGEHTRRHAGLSFPLSTAAFFCVMLTRVAYEAVGPMDEAFGVGFFEDDDYCRRLHQRGLDVICADDVFVHHHLSASFNKLKAEAKQALFETNKAVYEAKWGPWVPHTYRERHPPA